LKLCQFLLHNDTVMLNVFAFHLYFSNIIIN
jgi:hypothetical protein